MTAVEAAALQGRLARLNDRFRAMWTFHQFATGAFRSFLTGKLPYDVDFPRLYDALRAIPPKLSAGQAAAAQAAIEAGEESLARATAALLTADDRIAPSLLRRVFERLKRQDHEIVDNLIRFYLYADAVEGDRRDKLDFLFTRIAEEYRDSLELRERVLGLVAVLRVAEPPREEVLRVCRAIRSMRDDLQNARSFDELSQRNLLKNARTFKHRIGDLYFQPDVLLAIVELNVVARSRFAALFSGEEHRLLEDAQKLMKHGDAIARNFGESNPELAGELARFRGFKARFDTGRAESNMKHDVVAQLKASMNNILAQLDRGLDVIDETPEMPERFLDETRQLESLTERFGRETLLLPYLAKIASAVDVANEEAVRELRLEPWESTAYDKLFERREAETDEDNEELWVLYLRAAALRLKVDEEATIIATAMAAGVRPEPELLTRAKKSLDSAKELDEQFGDLLQEAVYYNNPKIVHQLYRSRFRLLRGFSGLWLIYDRQG